MKKRSLLCLALIAALSASVSTGALASEDIINSGTGTTMGGNGTVKQDGLYYPGGYWKDGIYYQSGGYWKNGVYYPPSYSSNSPTPNYPVGGYWKDGIYYYTDGSYWKNGVYYPSSSSGSASGYWKDGVYYPNSTGTNGYWSNGVFYPQAYYPQTTTYPYSGYVPYGYYNQGYYNPTGVSTLGGVTVPNKYLTQAIANNANIGFSLRGTSQKYAYGTLAPIQGQSASVLDFYETVGRTQDDKLVVTLVAVGTGVADVSQEAVVLNSDLSYIKKAREQKVEAIAFTDKSQNIITTINLDDTLVSNLQKACDDNKLDAGTTRFIVQSAPMSADYQDKDVAAAVGRIEANSSVYSVKAFLVSDTKKIDVSSYFGDVNLRVKAQTSDRSLLAYYNGSKLELGSKGTFVLDQSTNVPSAYSNVPMGSTVVIARLK